MAVLEFLKDHAVDGLAIFGALVALLKVVAPLTPTDVDNKIANVLSKLVAKLSGVVTPKLKDPAE